MSKVFVKYGFIFDPRETWSELSDFEHDLARFFNQHGLKAELVETVADQEEMVIIYITKDEQIITPGEDTREKEING